MRYEDSDVSERGKIYWTRGAGVARRASLIVSGSHVTNEISTRLYFSAPDLLRSGCGDTFVPRDPFSDPFCDHLHLVTPSELHFPAPKQVRTNERTNGRTNGRTDRRTRFSDVSHTISPSGNQLCLKFLPRDRLIHENRCVSVSEARETQEL